MAKFRPHNDRKHTQCPWCGAKEDTRTYVSSSYSLPPYPRIKPRYRNWECGSIKRGIEPIQDKNCEVNVQESIVYRLEEQIKTMQDKIDALEQQIVDLTFT